MSVDSTQLDQKALEDAAFAFAKSENPSQPCLDHWHEDWPLIRDVCSWAHHLEAGIRAYLTSRVPDDVAEIANGLRTHQLLAGGAPEYPTLYTAAAALIERQSGEIARKDAGLRAAEEWLSGWASAEPYLTTIRAALSPQQQDGKNA